MSEESILAALDHVEDDVLRLMFLCCHPSLTPEAQTTLTLRLVAGLSAREIARAYLTTESTVAQRLVRAKKTLATVGAALEEPGGTERHRAAGHRARGHLPAVQRGVRGDRRHRTGPGRPCAPRPCGSAGSWCPWCRATARPADCSR